MSGAVGRRHRWALGAIILGGALAAGGILLRPPVGPPFRDTSAESRVDDAFVGSATCRECHESEFRRWLGSDHDLAMDVATDATVLGDFDDAEYSDGRVTTRFYRRDGKFLVRTEGPGGKMAEFQITHVFGHDPLQQYLIPFPGGRLQSLNVTWDAVRGAWYRQYPDQEILPDNWLHWTRGGQNWNGMCAECHSTNLRKGYDPATDTYETTWSEIDVGCEACHGPGLRHVAWARSDSGAGTEPPGLGLEVAVTGVEPRRIVDLCAPCHARRWELGDYDHTGGELLDQVLPSLLDEGLYYSDGQILDEVYVYGSFLQSRMYAGKVSCPDCHDSHSLALKKEGNELCLQCHERETYDTRDHHFHRKVVDGRESEGARCVRCHMAERPYMVIDWRADHSFRVPRPDLSEATGAPNACTQSGCHDDRPLSWSVDAFHRWYGDARRPHFGTTFAAARRGDPAAAPGLARLCGAASTASIVRSTALELLSRFDSPEVAAALRGALEAGEPLVRRTAAAYLPLAGRDDVGRLAGLLSDSVKAVRMAAVSRLASVPRELLDPDRRSAFATALAEYRRALDHSLDFAGSAFNLGNLEAALGNPAAAERAYRRALEIDGLFLPARSNLAVILSGQGRNPEAEAQLREVLREEPDDAGTMLSLGLLRVEMGDMEDGVRWLTRAAEARPDDARVLRNLGLLLQQMGRLDEAGTRLEQAYGVAPDSLEVMHAWADHLLRRGRLKEAGQVAERMIRVHPDAPIGRQLKEAIHRRR